MDLPKPAEKTGGAGVGAENFLNVADGESQTVIFRGLPLLYYQHWPNGGDKQIFTEPTPGAKPRYMWNAVIFDPKNKKFVAKVWDMAGSTYELLFKINKHSPLEQTKIEISRKGTLKNTRWTIIPLGPVDPKALPQIEAVPLNILHREPSASVEETEADSNDGLPF